MGNVVRVVISCKASGRVKMRLRPRQKLFQAGLIFDFWLSRFIYYHSTHKVKRIYNKAGWIVPIKCQFSAETGSKVLSERILRGIVRLIITGETEERAKAVHPRAPTRRSCLPQRGIDNVLIRIHRIDTKARGWERLAGHTPAEMGKCNI